MHKSIWQLLQNKLFLCLAAITLGMAAFCAMTPLAADDYDYALTVGAWSNIPAIVCKNYLQWTGRVFSILISDMLVLLPAWTQAIAAPAAFLLLFISMLQLIHGRAWWRATSAMQAIFLMAALWFSVPAFGTVFFWRIGTAHYLWTHCCVFFFMAQFRLMAERTGGAEHGFLPWAGLMLLALLAGWSIETACFLPCCYVFALMFHASRIERRPLPRRGWGCAAAVLIGMLLLLLAPGNYARMAHESEHVRTIAAMGLFEKIPYYADKMLMGLGMYFPVVLCAALLLPGLCRRPAQELLQDKRALTALLFLAFALLCTAALFFSPSYPLRAFTSLTLCYAVAVTAMLAVLEERLPSTKILQGALTVLLLGSVLWELSIFAGNFAVSQQRDRAIAQAGGGDAVFPPFTRQDKFFFAGGDILDLPACAAMQARYYGLRSIRVAPSVNP